MKIVRDVIPQAAKINNFLPADHSDVYSCELTCCEGVAAGDIVKSFWTDQPGWVGRLFKLRNAIVKPFGLKGGARKWEGDKGFEESLSKGADYGLAKYPVNTEREMVMSMDDKHLQAFLGVYLTPPAGRSCKAYFITLVKYHNNLGRVYFFLISPFHHLIVKRIIMRYIKKREISRSI